MSKQLDKLFIDAMVRDFTSVEYIVRPKSEVRTRIYDLVERVATHTREEIISMLQEMQPPQDADIKNNFGFTKQ